MAQHLARLNQIKSGGIYIAGGLAVGLSLVIVGNITGCNSFLAAQAEQDIATSTSYERITEDKTLKEFKKHNAYTNKKRAENASDDDMTLEEYEASQQAKNAAHANAFIAKVYGRQS